LTACVLNADSDRLADALIGYYNDRGGIPNGELSDVNESRGLVRSDRNRDETIDPFPTPRCPVSTTVCQSSRLSPTPFSSERPPPSASTLPFPVRSRDRKSGSSLESSSVWSAASVQGSKRCRKFVKLRTCNSQVCGDPSTEQRTTSCSMSCSVPSVICIVVKFE